MVYIKCFAPLCGSRHGKSPKCHFFLAPKNHILLNQWRRAIPRKDQTLSEKDYLCDKHFLPEDIIRFETVVVNGEVNNLPRRPILKESAIPCIWPNCPSYLTKEKKKARKPPKNRCFQNPINRTVPKQYQGPNYQSEQDINCATPSVDDTISDDFEETVSYNNSTSESQIPALPTGWTEFSNPCDTNQTKVYTKTVIKEEYPFVFHQKICKVDPIGKNIEFYAFSKPWSCPDIDKCFWTDYPLHLSSIITAFDDIAQD